MSKNYHKLIIYQVLVRLAGNTQKGAIPHGTIEQNGCGKFNDLSDVFLNAVRELGATHIWLTGILEHATCTDYSQSGIKRDNPLVVKGMAGSPYAVKDYYDVDPDLAQNVENRMVEFEALLERCLKAGLKPLIDFVPNHVARQYHSDNKPGQTEDFGISDDTTKAFRPDHNFYYIPGKGLRVPAEVYKIPYIKKLAPELFEEFPAKATGNDQFHEHPGINDWYETIKLNYGVDYQDHRKKHFDPIPDTWHKMLDIILFWADKGISGFRCDMAEMVPVEFWGWVIPKVKSHFKDVVFIAEIYNPSAYHDYIKTGKFDYLYDKMGLYDTVRAVTEQKQPAHSITQTWHGLDGIDHNMLRFIENHDEQRVSSPFFGGSPLAGIAPFTVSATIHQGPVMVYFGQETGEPAEGSAGYSGNDGRTSIFDYCSAPTFRQWFNNGKCDGSLLNSEQKKLYEFYRQLLKICKHPVIAHGNFYDLMWANNPESGFNHHHCYAFLRWDVSYTWLILVNFHPDQKHQLTVNIPHHFYEISKRNPLENNIAEHILKSAYSGHQKVSILDGRLKVEAEPFSSMILSLK